MTQEPEPQILTTIDFAERAFFAQDLLRTEYFQLYRRAYDETHHTAFWNPHRNYLRLMSTLDAVFAQNPNHARSYAKRLRTQARDWKSCEAVFAELIVYYSHIALLHEGHLSGIDLEGAEADLIVTRRDGSIAFLEVMSVMPDFRQTSDGLIDVRTHTQDALSSVRQKLLHKIASQGQMSAKRENWAVVELNDIRIAGQFTVLSSLSSGYKVAIDGESLEVRSEGYDWSDSIFHGDRTPWLKGVVFFDLGNYADRGVLVNPFYDPAASASTSEA